MQVSTNKIKRYINAGYDLNFLSRIQSENVNFRENDAYIKQGDGYHVVAHTPTDKFPESGLPEFWMEPLMLLENVNTFVSIAHASNEEMSSRTAKAIKNLLASNNRNTTDDVEDRKQVTSLIDFRSKIGNNIASKKIHVRYFVSGDTEKELRENIRDIKSRIPHFHVATNDGMQDIEYHAAFIPASRQDILPLNRKGQPVSVIDLGAGYPFNHTTLMDPRGTYLGFTRTGGAVILNILQVDNIRSTPTVLIAGQGNTSKGKLVGVMNDALFAKGHRLLTIDLTGEMSDLTRRQGGRVIDSLADGHENNINIMEVMGTALSYDGVTVNEVESFREQRMKMQAIAQIKDPNLTPADLNNLGTALRELYIEQGLWSWEAENSDPDNFPDDMRITNVVRDQYPTIGQLNEKLSYLFEEKQEQDLDLDAESYRKLLTTFRSITQDYGFLNRHSNYEDFSNENVLSFDFSMIKDKTLLSIQIYQILTLISSYAISNSRKNKLRSKQDDSLDKDQLPHVIITITGADKLFDFRHPQSLEFLQEIISSVSTGYAAVILEMSSLQNILLSSNSDGMNPYVLATRKIFGAMKYRIFSNLDDMTIPLLANALQGEMTESEISSLKTLQNGQFFLNIANVKNLTFDLQLTDFADMGQYELPYAEVDRYKELT